jgi:hypothetical protein
MSQGDNVELCAIWAAVVAAPRDPAAIGAAAARFDALLDHVERCARCAAAAAALEQDRGALSDLYDALAAAGQSVGANAEMSPAAVAAALEERRAEEEEVAAAVEEALVPGLSAAARAIHRRVAAGASPAQIFLGLDAIALLLHRLPAGALELTASGAIVRGDEELVPRAEIVEEVARMAELDAASAAALVELTAAALRDNPLLLLGVEATPVGADRVALARGERSAEEDLAARWLRGYAQRAAAPRIEIVDLSDRPDDAARHRAAVGDANRSRPRSLLGSDVYTARPAPAIAVADGFAPAASAQKSAPPTGMMLAQAASAATDRPAPWRWSRAVAAGAALAVAAASFVVFLVLHQSEPPKVGGGAAVETNSDKNDKNDKPAKPGQTGTGGSNRFAWTPLPKPPPPPSDRCACLAQDIVARHRLLAAAGRDLGRAGFTVRPVTKTDLGADPTLAALDGALVVRGHGAELVVGSFPCASAPSCSADRLGAITRGDAIGIGGLLVQRLDGSPLPTAEAIDALSDAILGRRSVASRNEESKTPEKPARPTVDGGIQRDGVTRPERNQQAKPPGVRADDFLNGRAVDK